MKEYVIAARKFRENLMGDPYRPGYHIAMPDDCGLPGDPNGAFFADGVCHLMYLYRNTETNAFHWGHMTSTDLLHWHHRPDALTAYKGDGGCFSGGAFLDEDGTAYLTFWKFASLNPEEDKSGIGMAYARPPYDHWERMEPIAINATEWGILDLTVNGEVRHIGCADPSNIWKAGDTYYMQCGNLVVLNEYGRKPDSPAEYKGGWTELFCSKDLKHWEYVHRFYENTCTGEDWPDETEDDMCPSFLPLYDAPENGKFTGKYLQLFIAHNKGSQYFIGSLENEKFIPEVHGRMSWKDNTYFAPEALIDDQNRQIMWAWYLEKGEEDNEQFKKYGWVGTYSLPRQLWLEGNVLHMSPVKELEQLQFHHQIFEAEGDALLPVKNGHSFRLRAVFDMKGQERAGIRVRSDGRNYTDIYWDQTSEKLVMDTTYSGTRGRNLKEEAPFSLQEGELLKLDILVDESVCEVYANERQAIGRRIYPDAPEEAVGVQRIGKGAVSLESWEMFPSNPF